MRPQAHRGRRDAHHPAGRHQRPASWSASSRPSCWTARAAPSSPPTPQAGAVPLLGRETTWTRRPAPRVTDLGELVAGRIVVGASSRPGRARAPGECSPSRATFRRDHRAARRRHPRGHQARPLTRVRDRRGRRRMTRAPNCPGRRAPRPRRDWCCLRADAPVGVGANQVSLGDLSAEPQAGRRRGAGVRIVVEDHLRRPASAGAAQRRRGIDLGRGVGQQAVIAGGVTFLSRSKSARGRAPAAAGRAVGGSCVLRDFYAVRSKTRC